MEKIRKRHCSCLGCKSVWIQGNKDNIVFHKIPKDVCYVWLQRCGRPDLLSKSPEMVHNNNRICGLHFTDEQYTSTLRTRLKKYAIPTIFPSDTEGSIPVNRSLHSSFEEDETQENSVCRVNADSAELIPKTDDTTRKILLQQTSWNKTDIKQEQKNDVKCESSTHETEIHETADCDFKINEIYIMEEGANANEEESPGEELKEETYCGFRESKNEFVEDRQGSVMNKEGGDRITSKTDMDIMDDTFVKEEIVPSVKEETENSVREVENDDVEDTIMESLNCINNKYFSKVRRRRRALSEDEDDYSSDCEQELLSKLNQQGEQSERECLFSLPTVVSAGPSKPPKKKVCRQYMDSYLSLGFTWTGDRKVPQPMCLNCGQKLANGNMVPSKLKRHLLSKHKNLANAGVQYFERLLKEHNRFHQSYIETQLSASDKMQIVSYQVAELIAQQTKPLAIAEKLILPACCLIVKTLFGDDAEQEVMKIPLCDNSIHRRIVDMSANIEMHVSKNIKSSKFAIQVDVSCDISDTELLLAYIRFVYKDTIITQFLCCKELEKHAGGRVIFQTLSGYLEKIEISWDACIGICIDGASSMTGSMRDLVSHIKQKNPDIILTHCFLHTETLVGNTLVADLKLVLDQAVCIVSFIKSKLINTPLFADLCKDVESKHKCLILHTEAHWLSHEKVLNRILEMKIEVKAFLEQEGSPLHHHLVENDWCAKLAYLADIFSRFNWLNYSMQGRNINILTTIDKLTAFKKKLQIWHGRAVQRNLEMFPLVKSFKTSTELYNLIQEHLSTLIEQTNHYLPSISAEKYDWVRDPFENSNCSHLSLDEEEEMACISSDRTLKLKHAIVPLDSFWIFIQNQYPLISSKALSILLQFSSSHFLEQGFLALTEIKDQKTERLYCVDEELRVCLSHIRPNINELTS